MPETTWQIHYLMCLSSETFIVETGYFAGGWAGEQGEHIGKGQYE